MTKDLVLDTRVSDIGESWCYMDQGRTYRYLLGRSWASLAEPSARVCWIMLNPSTADVDQDDPTIRRVRGFTNLWGFNGFTVVNLYALRSTDPAALRSHPHPIGSDNDAMIMRAVNAAACVVLAWGANAEQARAECVMGMLRERPNVYHLGLTKAGQPRHPLYVKGSQKPMELWPVKTVSEEY